MEYCKSLACYERSELKDIFEKSKKFLGLIFSEELLVVKHQPFLVYKIGFRNVSRFAKICLVTYFLKLQNTFNHLSL